MPRFLSANTLRVYGTPKMVGLAALGLSSGLPRLLVFATLTFWLLEAGFSITAVGLFAATALPYSVKFLWANVFDTVGIPFFNPANKLRGWLVVLHLLTAAAIGLMSSWTPVDGPTQLAVFAVLLAFFSASLDVVIDAYRVQLLPDEEQGAGAAVAVFGYRIGMIAASAGALTIAARFESWNVAYAMMTGFLVPGFIASIRLPAPSYTAEKSPGLSRFVAPYRDFVARGPVIFLLLAVAMTFKLPDVFAGVMTNPLLVHLEYEKETIAGIVKTFGIVCSILGVFAGGAIVNAKGIYWALWIGGIFQMLSNAGFGVLALSDATTTGLTIVVMIENVSGGIATGAFVAYLSALCKREYSATQYAFLTASSSILHTLVSTSSGAAVASIGYPTYFFVTVLLGVPGLLLLAIPAVRNALCKSSTR